MWKALAAVLHMSNIAFDAKDDAQGEVAAVQDAAVSLTKITNQQRRKVKRKCCDYE